LPCSCCIESSFKKHNDATEANYLKKGTLDRKTKELAIVVAYVALKDSAAHLRCHMHAAQNAGATPEEMLELINSSAAGRTA
jgi:alkylhydroperoxidase/carboxymuconolactone decarboxylase family protein YurZ